MLITNIPLEGLVEQSAEELGIDRGHLDYVKQQLDLLRQHHKGTYEHSIRAGLKTIEILKFICSRPDFKLSADPKLGFYGMLHDIGKIEIPLEVLDAINFGEKEMEIMRNHPILGYNRLMEDGYSHTACLALTHHLWENPTYPTELPETFHRLNGARNHLLNHARLISIADHNDATRRKNKKYNGFDFETLEGRKAFMIQKDRDRSYLVEQLYQAKILD